VTNDVSDSIELVGDAVVEVITASNAVRGYTGRGLPRLGASKRTALHEKSASNASRVAVSRRSNFL